MVFSSNAKAFARYVIEFGRTNQTKPHDYWKSLEVMSEGLKKFGGSKGADYAKYIDDVLSTSLEPLEARIFYEQMKPIVEQFNAKMLGSIVYAFASGIKPIIENGIV